MLIYSIENIEFSFAQQDIEKWKQCQDIFYFFNKYYSKLFGFSLTFRGKTSELLTYLKLDRVIITDLSTYLN